MLQKGGLSVVICFFATVMVTAGTLISSLQTGVHKATGDVTVATSIFFTVYAGNPQTGMMGTF